MNKALIKNIILAFCIVLVALIVSYIGYSINSKTIVEKDLAKLIRKLEQTNIIILAKGIEYEDDTALLENSEKILENYYIVKKITEKDKVGEIIDIIQNGDVIDPTPNTMSVRLPIYTVLFLKDEENLATLSSDFYNIKCKGMIGYEIHFTKDTAKKIYEKFNLDIDSFSTTKCG